FSYSLLSLFFFPSSLLLLYLHSFPTRRSSDLLVIDKKIDRAIGASAFKHDPCPGVDWRRTCRDDITDIVMLQFPFACRACRSIQDRKSTRLNSSHVSISYAVFCLKKKKNKINI